MTTTYILDFPLPFSRPVRGDIYAHPPLHQAWADLTLPAGTWLLRLPPAPDTDYPYPHHYRLADGRVVAREQPLSDDEATILADTQAVAALQNGRPLAQIAWEERGVYLEQVDRWQQPFRLIRCPLCQGTTFVSVELAQVWCQQCNAQFTVRYTAGDPGFVVDCTWDHLSYKESHYLLPRASGLMLTMVCKNGGDLLAVRHTPDCHRDDCQPGNPALTDGQEGPLRAGLHACALGDVYDWSFYGHPPTVYDTHQHGSYQLCWPDGRSESWPASAFVRVSGLTWAEKRDLETAVSCLDQYLPDNRLHQDLRRFLQTWRVRPSAAPTVPGHAVAFPRPAYLAAGEKYLLYRWLLWQEKPGTRHTAVPVWLVVKEIGVSSYEKAWQVVRENICFRCGRPVSPAAGQGRGDEPANDHHHCREMWRRYGWRPPASVREKSTGEQEATSG